MYPLLNEKMGKNYFHKQIIKLCNVPRSFHFLSGELYGIFPTELLEMILYLEKAGAVTRDSSNMWLSTDAYSTKKPRRRKSDISKEDYRFYYEKMPVPHPLDFEWRFSLSALNFLTQKILKITDHNESILLLGMPTLYVYACRQKIERKFVLVERNKNVISELRQYSYNKKNKLLMGDIFTLSPNELDQFDCVIMDPPWYYDRFYSFTWLASKVLRIGGSLIISLPPLGTRLGIDKDRNEFISLCHELGLFLEDLESQKLPYFTPFFEYNALKANSINDFNPFWRKGDFAFFRLVAHSKMRKLPFNSPYSTWIEKNVQGVRFKISSISSSKKQSSNLIDSIVDGDILPSVSTRDSRRNLANIWTSGNRIYSTPDINTILRCLDEIINVSNNVLNSKKQKYDMPYKIVNFLSNIVKKEKEEYKNYLGWLHNAKEIDNFK